MQSVHTYSYIAATDWRIQLIALRSHQLAWIHWHWHVLLWLCSRICRLQRIETPPILNAGTMRDTNQKRIQRASRTLINRVPKGYCCCWMFIYILFTQTYCWWWCFKAYFGRFHALYLFSNPPRLNLRQIRGRNQGSKISKSSYLGQYTTSWWV